VNAHKHTVARVSRRILSW